jgi:hypothetical protein
VGSGVAVGGLAAGLVAAGDTGGVGSGIGVAAAAMMDVVGSAGGAA